MFETFGKRSSWLIVFVVALAAAGSGFGQSTAPVTIPPRPLLQDIKVAPAATPTVVVTDPLVKKTASSQAVKAISYDPVLANVDIPGYTGILVETLDGKPVVESASAAAFNPASNVKLATTFAVIKTFGPDYRFPTNVWTDGTIDRSTSTLTGNIYISGKDPVFGYEHAIAIANALNKLGVRNVTGDLVVTDNFAMNMSGSPTRASETLFATLDSSKRSAAAAKVWLDYLNNSGTFNQVTTVPSVTFGGKVYVQPMPSSLKLLFSHESAPLRDIIKATLCYSNNFLAERLGDMVGGPYAVARIVQLNTGVQPSDFSLQTSSGLGINRVTPAAMMKLLRNLRGELGRYNMTFADIMPVAGVDKGTLEERFDTDFSRGSVVAKTGTLGRTDGGASSLAGEINTRNGRLLFVVFNQHGGVTRFRSFQNNYISLIQGQFGGAAPLAYNPIPLDVRLARSRIVGGDVYTAQN